MDRTESKRILLNLLVDRCIDAGHFRDLTVDQVMTSSPACVGPDFSALKLVQMFHREQFRHLLVTDPNDQLLGIISDRDVLRCFGLEPGAAQNALESIPAEELMSTDLVTISPQATISEAVRLIVEYGINCLPVAEQNVPIGILTSTDLYLLLEQMLDSLAVTEPQSTTATD